MRFAAFSGLSSVLHNNVFLCECGGGRQAKHVGFVKIENIPFFNPSGLAFNSPLYHAGATLPQVRRAAPRRIKGNGSYSFFFKGTLRTEQKVRNLQIIIPAGKSTRG